MMTWPRPNWNPLSRRRRSPQRLRSTGPREAPCVPCRPVWSVRSWSGLSARRRWSRSARRCPTRSTITYSGASTTMKYMWSYINKDLLFNKFKFHVDLFFFLNTTKSQVIIKLNPLKRFKVNDDLGSGEQKRENCGVHHSASVGLEGLNCFVLSPCRMQFCCINYECCHHSFTQLSSCLRKN